MTAQKYDIHTIFLFCILCIILFYAIQTIKPRLGLSLHILTKDKYKLLPYNKTEMTKKDLSMLLRPNTILPALDTYHKIPKRLFQIYMYYQAPIPQYIYDGIHRYAPEYEHIVFDEEDAVTFLTSYFHSDVLQRFYELKTGAHKADLLRYCLLYIYGGVYLDIKTILVKPLNQIFTKHDCLYSSISVFKHTIHNGIIASRPRNPFFLNLIWYIVYGPIHVLNNRLNYLTFCRDFYINIQKDLPKNKNIVSGFNQGISQNYYLLEEQCPLTSNQACNNSDFSKVCCAIYDKQEKVFITRDPKFPW